MKINNENETDTLHSTYQIIKNPCNGKQCQHNILSYGETTDHTKHHTREFIKKNIFKYILIISWNKCKVTEYEMIIYEAIRIRTRGE